MSPPPAPPEWHDILRSDERILWQGAPQTDRSELKYGPETAAAGFAAIGVVAVLTYLGIAAADTLAGGVFVVLVGLAAACLAVYLTFGKPEFAAYKLRHSFYTLTNRRAFAGWVVLGRRRLDIWDINAHTRIELQAGRPGSVFFAEKVHRQADDTIWTERIGFLNIADAAEVFEMMLKVQRNEA